MARLVLGPLLRHVGATDATVWVEADAPCEVEVLGHRTRTFRVGDGHYALVVIEGLEPGGVHPYEVRLDGELAWPLAGAAPSVIRPLAPGAPLRLCFGSCRAVGPGFGPDALAALAVRMQRAAPEEWPDALLMVGDQVYADEVSPETRTFIAARRDPAEPPGYEIADFTEYVRLYHESWSPPSMRWLLANLPSSMLWDDHDVHDDWNISASWLEEWRAKPWWRDRIVGAIASYWLYQHLGNLGPAELAADELLARVRAADGDALPVIEDWAHTIHVQGSGARWSFRRDFGATRYLAVDCRAGRVLEPRRRSMLDEDEWRWVEDSARGDLDHLLIGLSDPWLLATGIHDLEAWNEAVCDGAWGSRAARVGEKIRRALDLDHWAAFGAAFARLVALVEEVGVDGPATIVALSGDVHHGYVARGSFPAEAGVRSAVFQATCSPFRNPLGGRQRLAQRVASSRAAAALGRRLARAAGVEPPRMSWRYETGLWFENQLATLEIDGRSARVRYECARPDGTLAGRLALELT